MSLELSVNATNIKESLVSNITAQAKQMKNEGKDIVLFGAGEPDFNTPENIRNAAIKAIKQGFNKYTNPSGIQELKEAICKKLKNFNKVEYSTEQIVISNGGRHSLTNIFQAIINPGDEIIIPSPYWSTFPEIVKLAYGVPVFVECKKENDFKITSEQLKEAISKKTKAIVLNNPNNPSGMLYNKEELMKIAKVVIEENIYVISDEIYDNLVYTEDEYISIASLGKEIYERTIICNGVSKTYAMTGWRIGYTASNIEIAKLMKRIQSHQTTNPNSIAQKAAVEAISGNQEEVLKMKKEFNKRRLYMFERIRKMPLITTLEPKGAFYIFLDFSDIIGKKYKGTEIRDTTQICKILLKDYLVAVVPGEDFGSKIHIRLSYAISMLEIEKGLDRIEKFVNDIT